MRKRLGFRESDAGRKPLFAPIQNSSALALNLGLFRGFRLDNYPWFPILILSPACQRRRTGDYQYSSTTGTHSQRLLPKHPVAAARALGHDQERRSDEHTRVRLDMTRSGGATSTRQRYLFGYRRRPDVAHFCGVHRVPRCYWDI